MRALRFDPSEGGTLVGLQAVGLCSNVDRYVTAPLLVALAHQFHASLTQTALVLSGNLASYGLTQIPWSVVLNRLGPVPVMRLSLIGAGTSACCAALAPSLASLVIARVVGGALLAAAVPAALLYVGTRLPGERRRHAFEGIVAANGLGIVIAVAIATIAVLAGVWRVGYLGSGFLLMTGGVLLFGLRLPTQRYTLSDVGSMAATDDHLAAIQVPRWGHVKRSLRPVLLAMVEGVVILGAVVVLPAVAERSGLSRVTSAGTIAVYGLAMPATSMLLRGFPMSFTLAVRTRIACMLLLTLPIAAATLPPLAALFTTAAMLGASWSVLHPALQSAATGAWVSRAPLVVSLFVSALFLGSASGSQFFASIAQNGGPMQIGLACVAGSGVLYLMERLTRRLQ